MRYTFPKTKFLSIQVKNVKHVSHVLHRQTDRETDRQTDRQTDVLTHLLTVASLPVLKELSSTVTFLKNDR